MTEFIGMEQKHGANVVRVGKKDIGTIVKNCDGLITNIPELTLSVRVADCLPIALYDPISSSIGLVHAGWRGLYKGIIRNAIKLMKDELEVDSEKLIVYIGPHICQEHYEVKNDVSGKFKEYPSAIKRTGGKTFIDLGKIAEDQLMSFGISKKDISWDKRCTFEDKNLFSNRRNRTNKRNIYFLKLSKAENTAIFYS